MSNTVKFNQRPTSEQNRRKAALEKASKDRYDFKTGAYAKRAGGRKR